MTFECSLDGQGYQPCGATVSYSRLGKGLHVFAARATDTDGDTDPTPVVLTTSVLRAGSR